MTADPVIADLVSRLDADMREYFEERAGIRQYDGGLPREMAECLALLDVAKRHPLALSGLTVLQVEQGASTRLLMTTDAERTRARLSARGATVSDSPDLSAAVRDRGGLVELARVE
jgi:hypothetical protein